MLVKVILRAEQFNSMRMGMGRRKGILGLGPNSCLVLLSFLIFLNGLEPSLGQKTVLANGEFHV
jgi:hypothetical protein